ncbi:DUF948 domain-containing protein [Tenuibacillus multivorans]|uniref:Uncharacterized protein YoxC, contains an MCP-like domain n=1 Tax=Tenuibacillus multivorans TaxID=237069 RepID=A0A1H0EEV9_9BACI|nr:DUF948 domain-containing protein [Tenuibacillus multivorans]GEL77189.1 UPF0478 protein YtxG [Tenuibacillus multivorans]SDN80831.1 Uncharacterized protein YoxC, contains an MCP-like domain [Tenuibacillus multivorans]
MVNILHISALIASIAFLILVIYISYTLVSVRKTFHHMANTTEALEKQMQGITHETTELLKKTNYMAADISGKTDKLDVLFDGVKGIGQTVQEFNESLQKLSDELKEQASEHAEKTSQTIKWGEAAIHLWKKYKDK